MTTRLAASLLVLLLAVHVAASPVCSHLKGCERKFCDIEQVLMVAKAEGNNNKTKGLSRSLENAKANCSDAAMRETLLKDIEDVRSDITDYESDIVAAEADGKFEKIAKYQRKIAVKKTELKLLEQELTEFDR